MHITDGDTQRLQRRLARIGGQVRGVHTMIAQGRNGLEICDQIEAIMGGLQAVQWALAREFIRTRAIQAVQCEDAAPLERAVIELYARQTLATTKRRSARPEQNGRPTKSQWDSDAVGPAPLAVTHLIGPRVRSGKRMRKQPPHGVHT